MISWWKIITKVLLKEGRKHLFSVRLDDDDDKSLDDYHHYHHYYDVYHDDDDDDDDDDVYQNDAEGGGRTFAFSQTGPFSTWALF